MQKYDMKKLLITLLCLSFFSNAEERMTPLINMAVDENWWNNEKNVLYLMERCLAVNSILSIEDPIGRDKRKDWFRILSIDLFNSIYKSTKPRDENEVNNLIMERSGEMFLLYLSYMKEDYLSKGNQYGDPLAGDIAVCNKYLESND